MNALGTYIKEKLSDKAMNAADLARLVGSSPGVVSGWLNGGIVPRIKTLKKIAEIIDVPFEELTKISNKKEDDEVYGEIKENKKEQTQTSQTFTQRLNSFKNQPDSDRDGISFVPIAAQAGYSRYYLNPVFITQLERIYMPGFPYRGNRYRIFEVDGSSMEPTLKEGYYILCEKAESEGWQSLPDYYMYVIITKDRILVKRIFKKTPDQYVLISDNEDYFPQFTISVSEIMEIWQVKRKMDWELSPPRKFEIKV